jgi:pyruvate,water dikinase
VDRQILWFEEVGMEDVAKVGGKNASLGEMLRHLAAAGVRVPRGFATTAKAFEVFLQQNGLAERIEAALANLDIEDTRALAEAGAMVRNWIVAQPFPAAFEEAVAEAFGRLEADVVDELTVAVRSSATAEDLPQASFAGQQETFLNVRGLEQVMLAVKHVFASLYNDRAIVYRVHQGFAHSAVRISAGVQRMVRSDEAASGVMFTLDTETGFRDAVFITGAYGLGETVVQGSVNPDEFYVYKPNLAAGRPAILRRSRGSKTHKMVFTDLREHGRTTQTVAVAESDQLRFCLTDTQVEALARQGMAIEDHYRQPMDIEWALDEPSGELFIVQARPETVESRTDTLVIERFQLRERGRTLAEGRAIGQRIGAGPARVIAGVGEMDRVQVGDVLVTDMTDPDWEPIMKRAAAIVTNRGGRTCHAAIVAREMGIPAVVGCGNATSAIGDGAEVTVSCAEGDTGHVYDGRLEFAVARAEAGKMPSPPVKIMMNVGDPNRAFGFARLPHAGVGLARLEFIINTTIGIHPLALLELEAQPEAVRAEIRKRTAGYADPVSFYVEKLVEGIGTIAAAFHPSPVIVRMSDFKSNEYANLYAGEAYEPGEENPMLGFRGASRYVSDLFRPAFELECRAVRKVRDEMGLTNCEVMIPFCRTLEEAAAVSAILAENGLVRGRNGLRVVMMCEIPSNVLLADRFLDHFDGFSIGSNDLTQLTLGLDRDSERVASLFDERNPAVKGLLAQVIRACRARGRYIGICGQAPSDYPEFAAWLVGQGISSISLNPDTVVDTWLYLARSNAAT